MFHIISNERSVSRRVKSRRCSKNRQGAAVVELALLLPVMIFVVLGSLELCERMMLRQSAAVAAYETARLAARRTTTAPQAIARGESILEGRRITGGQVVINPGNLTSIDTGDELTVTVTVPVEGNTPITYAFPVNGAISVSATMLRE